MSRSFSLPALPVVLALLLSGPAAAATFSVTNLADSGPGSLRQAVLEANASDGADEIVFAPGLAGTITLTSGQIAITDSLVVNGPGIGALTISGNDQFRIFLVEEPAVDAPIEVTLSGLTLTHGRGLPAVPSAAGGAVLAYGENLTILGSVILSSQSGTETGPLEGGCGGNVALLGTTNAGGGTLRIADSLLSDGRVLGTDSRLGGNLCLNGRLLMERSTLSGGSFLGKGDGVGAGLFFQSAAADNLIANSAFSGNHGSGSGGGIALDTVVGLTIELSTIAGNTVSGLGFGGGINVFNSNLRIVNSTVSENIAESGGGIFSEQTTLEMVNGTVSGNQARRVGGGIGGYGTFLLRLTTVTQNTAGIAGGSLAFESLFPPSVVELDHSILANGAPQDLSGTGPVPGGLTANYSLIEAPGTVVVGGAHNLIGTDPLLGPLTDNGGPTLTHALLPGSPVRNAGDPAIVNPPATDQRGSVRIVGPAIDLGSVESGALVEVPTVSEIGLLALCALILAAAVVRMRRMGAAQ